MMKSFLVVSAVSILSMVLCGIGFAVNAPMAEGHGVGWLLDPDTGIVIGGVFFAVGLLWNKRLIKK